MSCLCPYGLGSTSFFISYLNSRTNVVSSGQMSSRERSEPQSRQESAGNQDGDSRPLSEALARLERAVSAIHDSEAFRTYLDTQARFHRYSWGNVPDLAT